MQQTKSAQHLLFDGCGSVDDHTALINVIGEEAGDRNVTNPCLHLIQSVLFNPLSAKQVYDQRSKFANVWSQIKQNMSNFNIVQIVGCGSESQLQVVENKIRQIIG